MTENMNTADLKLLSEKWCSDKIEQERGTYLKQLVSLP